MSLTLTPSKSATPFPEKHSDEVHEIIGRPPHWLVRWGTILFFSLAISLGLGTWWVRFPDTVTTSFSLTATDAPRAVIVRVEGKLTKLLVRNGEKVDSGQILAYSESTGDHEQVLELTRTVRRISENVAQGRWAPIHEFSVKPYKNLGEVQGDFHTFNQQIIELKSFLVGGFYLQKRKLLVDDQNDLVSMEKILSEQMALQNRDLQLANDEFQVQEKLYKGKVISALEHNREKSKLLSREIPIKSLGSSIIQNRSAQTAKQKELLELDNTIQERKANFLQSLQTLSNSLENWKLKYILTAPVSGSISFSAPWQEQQYLTSGIELMTVEPLSSTFQGIIKVAQANVGKIKEGQTVLVKLDGFPYREYGTIEGKLSQLSIIPGKDSTYWGYVDLPNKLMTRYGHSLPYRNGLIGQAEIITADRSLAERLIFTIGIKK